MPEITIVNTSPIFYLNRLGLLDILKKLYGVITIPEAVKDELEQPGFYFVLKNKGLYLP